jgi:hypothetical protein
MSTIKVNNIVPPNVGEGVSIDGLQMPTAGALSNRNLIINGGMQLAQRGTSSTVSSYGTVDRVRTSYSGGTITQSQEDLISTDTPYSLGFRKNWRLTNTAPITNLANHHRRTLYRIEAQDIANSGWDYTNSNSYITISMWARSSVAQTFNWFMQAIDGTVQRYPWEVTLAANTWTKITKSFPGNSNLTFDNDNGLGLTIDMGMYWGTVFTTSTVPLDQWGAFANDERTRDFDATWGQTTGATFDLVGVQLEVGSKATPFEHESYSQTLAKCQRYYYQVHLGDQIDTVHVPMMRFEAAAGAGYAHLTFPCEMNDNPNFTFTGTAHSASGYAGNPRLNSSTKSSASLISSRTMSANKVVYLRAISSSNGSDVLILNFEAEL